LDKFEVGVKIVWKGCHSEEGWKGLRYGLQFVRITEEGRKQIRKIIHPAGVQENNLFNQFPDSGGHAPKRSVFIGHRPSALS
jgi:hypothetical protein